MPIYEYSCPKCGEFEQRQSIHDDPLRRCPKCRSKVTKLISASGFHLKGGGWYADAYQKKSSSTASSGDAATSNGSEKPASTPAKETTSAKVAPSSTASKDS